MRFKFFILSVVYVLCAGMTACNPYFVWAQPLDMDREERIFQDEPFIEETKSQIEAENPEILQKEMPLREIEEIKYVAGADGKWFTKDDDVYEYFLLSYDSKGRLVRRSGFWEGADSRLMTKDDVLHDYLVYEYGADGSISREILYDGAGVEQYTGIYGYDNAGIKTSIKKYDPQKKEIGSTNFFRGHAGLIIRDVEYKGDEIEKYHLFKYDSKHNTGRVSEFLGAEGGKGADGVWFTDDDKVTSTKQCFYNLDGTKKKEKKYIGPGRDKKWFTKDDVMQYYTLFYY